MSALSTRMPSRVAAIAAVAVSAVGWSGHAPPVAAARAADPSVISATLKDQVDLAVTVYNSNIALVRDVRQLALPAGALDLRLADIAATVNPATVHFRSLTEPARLGILEQNYEYDLLGPERLLRKYVGRNVTL